MTLVVKQVAEYVSLRLYIINVDGIYISQVYQLPRYI